MEEEEAKTPCGPRGTDSWQTGRWTMWDGDPPARDQPAPGPPGTPSGQASPRLTLGPVLLPREQGLAPAMLLKALPIPLYHMVSPGAPQPQAALGPSGLDGASLPFILSPLLRPEGPGPAPEQVGKSPAPVLTVSLVGALPVLSPGPGPPLGSPGRVRSAGRYLCPHCGRDCLKPSVLEKHIRSHTGERPFPCATCGIAFKTQSNLYKHRRTQTHLNNAHRPSESDEADRADSQDPKEGRASEEQSLMASAPCPVQRQQATTWEKGWEGRLRKCESSDSGYLSRSDSAEQPPAPTSPLCSQSEAGSSSEPGPAGELEKRRLEERIARLISHNQAVMDDAQLDTVRPRKTVLSKQGSIDLPMPYTYRDSFHFDMRAQEPGRRRPAPLGPTHAPCILPDKARPLSFHSVPTQLSTTAQCVSVTRSNSLPFLEGTRSWREWAPDPQEAGPRWQHPGGSRPSPARLDRSSGPVLSVVPSSHPRALVRQAAVEDLPGIPSGETTIPAEPPPRSTAGDRAVSRGRATGKRLGQRRLKLFSQEKWQMYGDETFRRIYQKGKAGHRRGQKTGERAVDPSAQAEPSRAEATRTPMCGDTKTLGCGDVRAPESRTTRTLASGDIVSPPDSGSELGPQGGRLAESYRASSGGCETAEPPTVRGRDTSPLGVENPLLSPSRVLESRAELFLGPGDCGGAQLGVSCSAEGGKSPLWRTPGLASSSPGQALAAEDRHPTERKKLKIEGLGGQDERAETVEGSTQAACPPAWACGSDPAERPRGSLLSADPTDCGLTPMGISSASSLAAPRPPKAPPFLPVAASPECHPQSPHNAFTPKYLLRLSQGDPSLELPAKTRSGQDHFCSRGWPEAQSLFTQSAIGTTLSPGAASGRTSGEANIMEDPVCSWPRKGVEGTQADEEGEDRRDTSPIEPRDPASVIATPTPTPGSDSSRHTKMELPITCPLCSSSTSLRARPPGGDLSPWPETPSLDSLAGFSSGRSFQSGPFLSAIKQPPAWPLHSGHPRHWRAEGPFPSLGAEPRLTWCCLSVRLPLPAEQKEKASSLGSALNLPVGDPRDKGPEGLTVTIPGDPGPAEVSKPSCPTAPGRTTGSQNWAPELRQRSRAPPRGTAKMPRGSGRQRKLRFDLKSRYKAALLQSRVQLRPCRLRKPPRMLRGGCHPHPCQGGSSGQPLLRRPSGMTGTNPQGEPSGAPSEASRCLRSRGESEDSCRGSSVAFAPGTNPSGTREIDNVAVQELSPPAGDRGNCLPGSTAVAGSGAPLESDTCLAVGKDHVPSRDKGVAGGLPETPLGLSPEHTSVDPKPVIDRDSRAPLSFQSQGAFLCGDPAASEVAMCTSLGTGARHSTLGIPSAEPQGHGWTTRETLARMAPERKATVESPSPSSLPGKSSSGQRISGAIPLKSTEEAHVEIPTPGQGTSKSHQEEKRCRASFAPRGHHECGGKGPIACPSGSSSKKCQGVPSGALDCRVPSRPGQPTDIPKAPSKTAKKRSLEGMRKQTRVEFSDASSDDEDRLVIEI